ncbi:GNAT family N-acetyltransferase [Lapidilactobacillus wuchangensis]|uniref:GNAT family N-acetyltransferase n=1 Tax=Lapidilactobacillus wuchangensis TaxID=2486001 RepID=UPI000F772C32|nr:GNAT family N-acetyltransferase [Lapidilactobacillus wuchangensis]
MNFQLREYRSTDLTELTQLFYQTVHQVNCRDYSVDQLNAWADGQLDLPAWNASFLDHETIVAVNLTGQLVGFGDLAATGYLDRLYVHAAYQHQGIATTICDRLEHDYSGPAITTAASITARPFFQQRGYQIQRQQQVIRHGVALTNFVMVKYF